MADAVEVRLVMDKTLQQAALLEPSFLAGVKKMMNDGTLYLHGRAVVECPVDKGFLRASHHPEIGFPVSREIATASYGGFVHDGTRFQDANPWMQRARNDTVRWLRGYKITIRIK